MPQDVQVPLTTARAAPYDYPVPIDAEIILRSVSAKFADNGAAVDWLPALELISDSGHRIVRCVDPNVKVTAGDGAEASWFPGNRPIGAGATPSSSVVMPYATVSVGSWSWPVGSSFVNFGAGSVLTSDSSVLRDDSFTTPSAPITILKAGIYLAWGGIGPWDPAWGTQALLAGLGPDLGSYAGLGDSATNVPLTFTPVGGITGSSPTLVTVTSAILSADPVGGAQVRMEVNQNSGASRNVSAAITVIRLTGNGTGN